MHLASIGEMRGGRKDFFSSGLSNKNVGITHGSVSLASFMVTVSWPQSRSLQVGSGNAIALLDTNPPQLVKIVPALLAKLLDGPRAA